MWTKSVLAAAIASAALPARAAEPTETSAPESASDRDRAESKPKTLNTVRVEADIDEGLKAETQTTSSKLELSLRETPQSVTVITQESLKARQVTDFGQALEMSAGVMQSSGTGPFAGQAGFGFNSTTIRGIIIDDVNDVRDDGFVNTTYFAIPDMAIYDRVEIIKGPNSGVYGRGSAGGLINRIRKKPLTEARTEVALSTGSYDTYRADFDITGPIAGNENVLGRVVAAYADEGSFVDGVDRQRTVLAPSLELGVTEGTRVLLEGLYQRDNFRPNAGFPLMVEGEDRFDAPDIPRSTYVGVPNRKDNRWNIYTGTVQIDQALANDWLATLRINGNKTESPIKVDAYAYGFSDAGDTAVYRNKFAIDRDVWAGELKFAGSVDVTDKTVQIAAGAEFSDNDYHRRGAYADLGPANVYLGDFVSPEDVTLDPGREYTTRGKVHGYYVQAQVRPIERLSVLAGLRYDKAKSKYNDITSSTISRKSDDDVNGRIGLTYDLSGQVSVYGLYAQSYSPVLFDVDQQGNILDPESGEIYEVGLKTEWFDQRLGINVAAYSIDRDHIPIAAVVPPGEPGYSVSSGLQRSRGIELEANGRPLDGWTLSAAVNWLDSDFKERTDFFYGAKLAGSARWQVGLYSSYELQSGFLKGFAFGGSVFAIDDRGLSSFERGEIDGYARVDLNLAYKGLPTYEFQLSVRNILDERYIEGADRSGSIAQFGSPPAWLFTVRRTLQ